MLFIAKILKSNQYKRIVYSILGFYAVVLVLDATQSVLAPELFNIIEHYLVYALCADVIMRFAFINTFSVRSGWFWFDAITTFLAFIPGFEPCRAIRLFRLLGKYGYFRDSVEDTVLSIKWTIPLLGIGGLFVSVKGLMGYFAYHQTMPDQFGTFGRSVLTSFIMTMLEDLDNLYDMFEASWSVALVYMGTTVITGLLVIALVLAKVIDASHQNDPNGKR